WPVWCPGTSIISLLVFIVTDPRCRGHAGVPVGAVPATRDTEPVAVCWGAGSSRLRPADGVRRRLPAVRIHPREGSGHVEHRAEAGHGRAGQSGRVRNDLTGRG